MSSSSSSLQFVLTSSPDGPITAYDAVSGAAVSRFTGSRSPRNGLTLVGETSFAASHVSSATASGSIHLYNWWSSTAFHHLPVPEPVAPIAAAPDGSYLFAGGVSGSIHVLSLPSGTVIRSVPAHTKPVSCFRISHDGSLLISGGDDGAVVVSPILLLLDSTNASATTTSCHQFQAHVDSVTAISCIGISNPTIVSSSLDCTCKVWSLPHRTPLQTVSFPCAISGISVNPTGFEFFAAGSDGLIYRTPLEVPSKQARKPATWGQSHSGAVVSVAVANEGRSLVSASEDGTISIWDVESEKARMVLCNKTGIISDIVVVAGGIRNARRCCGGGEDGGDREMDVPVREVAEMAKEAEKDKNRAIDMLESAIAMYEKLLEMILKEAKRGSNSNSSNNNSKDEENN